MRSSGGPAMDPSVRSSGGSVSDKSDGDRPPVVSSSTWLADADVDYVLGNEVSYISRDAR